MDESTEEIARQIASDPSRANLERCLVRLRENQETINAAQARMDEALYDIVRAREFMEALQETHQMLEARVFLLLGDT